MGGGKGRGDPDGGIVENSRFHRISAFITDDEHGLWLVEYGPTLSAYAFGVLCQQGLQSNQDPKRLPFTFVRGGSGNGLPRHDEASEGYRQAIPFTAGGTRKAPGTGYSEPVVRVFWMLRAFVKILETRNAPG